jgi:hypothetical protein
VGSHVCDCVLCPRRALVLWADVPDDLRVEERKPRRTRVYLPESPPPVWKGCSAAVRVGDAFGRCSSPTPEWSGFCPGHRKAAIAAGAERNVRLERSLIVDDRTLGMKQRHDEGASHATIAREMGISRARVAQILRREERLRGRREALERAGSI